ncbi:hypothetical protein FACS1894102_5800 [Spirochaetia bacterium]|nr:hypothetical protein FACS1894102_5800 [Spirochaetia bacterium]
MPNEEDLFTIAILGQPFALEGFLKLHSLSGESDHIVKLKSVLVSDPDNTDLRKKSGDTFANVDSKKAKLLEIEDVKVSGVKQPLNIFIKFKGINTAEDAKKLSGFELLVPRKNAAKLHKDEYYIEDLKGLQVVNQNGCVLGTIVDIVEGGNGSLARIEMANAEKNASRLGANAEKNACHRQASYQFVPFRGEFFGDISLKKHQAILLADWVLE